MRKRTRARTLAPPSKVVRFVWSKVRLIGWNLFLSLPKSASVGVGAAGSRPSLRKTSSTHESSGVACLRSAASRCAHERSTRLDHVRLLVSAPATAPLPPPASAPSACAGAR